MTFDMLDHQRELMTISDNMRSFSEYVTMFYDVPLTRVSSIEALFRYKYAFRITLRNNDDFPKCVSCNMHTLLSFQGVLAWTVVKIIYEHFISNKGVQYFNSVSLCLQILWNKRVHSFL